MKTELLNFLSQYKKEITIAIITAVAAFFFTKALPAFLSFLQGCGAYLLAFLTGHRREFRFEKKYLAWLINQNKYLVNVPSQLLSPVHLPKQPEMESGYIQLRLKRSNESALELPISELVRPGAKTVILGDPGSGKTTQLRYFCLTYARLAKTPIFSYRKRKLLATRLQAAGNRIPILIYLNRLADADTSILSVAEKLLPESLAAIYPAGYFQRILENGKCILLLDGLDEVPTTARRNRVAEAISSLSNATNERNTWLVSSRIVGYNAQLHNSFETAIVQPLTRRELEKFVENWYRIKCYSSGFAESTLAEQRELHSQRATHLINTIRLNPGLASLATSPILVSLIALLHSVKIELPQSRALLYRDCVELLADRWDLFRGVSFDRPLPIPIEQKVVALMSVASHMHDERLREVKRSELENIISARFARVFKSSNQILPGEVINDLEERSGLLINRGLTEAGEKIMAFSHLSFQEYLTARSLLSSPKSNAKEILSTHFGDSWWREAILLYIAQIDSPRSLIEQIYADSFQGSAVEKVLLAAACLSEVKENKASELYGRVFSDVASMYSCGEIQNVTLSLLEPDKNNMLLRHMVDYLLRTTQEQARGLDLLLSAKRQGDPKPELVEEFVAGYSATPEVLDYDLKMLKAISRNRELPTEPVVSMIFRSPSRLDVPKEMLLADPITNQLLASIALAHSDWRKIMVKLALLAPYAGVDDVDPKQPVTGSFDHWKYKSITRLLRRHQTVQQGTSGQAAESQENLSKVREFLQKIREMDHAAAATIYRSLHGWLEPQEVKECEEDIEIAFEAADAQGKCLCVMLILRLRVVDDGAAQLLIEFISDTLKPRLTNSADENSVQLQAICLVKRAINSLTEYNFRTYEHISFILQCLESNLSDVVEFAMSTIERLSEIDDDARRHCDRLLTSSEPSKIWAGVLISSATKIPAGSVIETLLPQLYDKELIVRDKNIGDVAAHSILRILSNGVPAPVIE